MTRGTFRIRAVIRPFRLRAAIRPFWPGAAACMLLLTLGLTTGCSNKDRIPSDVLSRDKMEKVLWDMIQADQYASMLAKDSAHIDTKLERMRLYEQVFLLHSVTREQFRKSYDFYLQHPDLTQGLFDSLQSRGNRLRAEVYSRPSVNPVTPQPAAAPHHSPAAAHPSPKQKTLIP